MRTSTTKNSSTSSRSPSPLFSKKEKGGLSLQSKEAEPFFFAPAFSQQTEVGLSPEHNPFFQPSPKPVIQTKLTINGPGDQDEKEAVAKEEASFQKHKIRLKQKLDFQPNELEFHHSIKKQGASGTIQRDDDDTQVHWPTRERPSEVAESDIDALERTARGRNLTDQRERALPAAVGTAIERAEVGRWIPILQEEAEIVIRNEDFGRHRAGLRTVFRTGSGPDVIAISFREGYILVGDITSNPSSLTRVPELGRDQVPHLQKTARDAQIIAETLESPQRRLFDRLIELAPEEHRERLRIQGFKVYYQERYWEHGIPMSQRYVLSGQYRNTSLQEIHPPRGRGYGSHLAQGLSILLPIIFSVASIESYASLSRRIKARQRQIRARNYRIQPNEIDLFNLNQKVLRVFDHDPLEISANTISNFDIAVDNWIRRDFREGGGEWWNFFENKFEAAVLSNNTEVLGVDLMNYIEGTGYWGEGGERQYIESTQRTVNFFLVPNEDQYLEKAEKAATAAEIIGGELENVAQSLGITVEDLMTIYEAVSDVRYAYTRYIRSLQRVNTCLLEAYQVNRSRFRRLEEAMGTTYTHRGD